MSRTTTTTHSFLLLAAALTLLVCCWAAVETEAKSLKPVNPFHLLSNYHSHVEGKLTQYKDAFRKSTRAATLQSARHIRRHFAVLTDTAGTFDSNDTSVDTNSTDYDFGADGNLTDVSAACYAVWTTYALPNMDALSACGMEYGSFFVNPNLQQSDLTSYCDQVDADSCYNLFDNFLNNLYTECSVNDLDNLDLNGLDFSQLTSLLLPCYKHDNNQTCFADAIRMTHALFDFQPTSAAQLNTELDTFCSPCVQDLFLELSQTAGEDDSVRAAYYLLNNMCLKDGDTYCLVTLEQLHEIIMNFSLKTKERTIKALELVCSNNCYDMYISGLAAAYESSGGVDAEGNAVDVDTLESKNFNFCDRGADGKLCAVKIMEFVQTYANASESCPFGSSGSGSSGSNSGVVIDYNGTDPVPPPNGSGGTDSGASGVPTGSSEEYSGGDGLGSLYELPDGAAYEGFADDFNDTMTCNAECKQFVAAFVQDAGCCIGSFLRYVSPDDSFDTSAPYLYFQNTCGNDIPDPCTAEGLVEGTLSFENLNIAFVNSHLEDFRLYVRLDLSFSLAIDKNNIKITYVREFNSFNHYLMAAGVSVGYSIVTPDVEVRDRVSNDLKEKIQSGGLALTNINSLPASARIDTTKSIGVSAASASSITTGTVPLGSSSDASTLAAFSIASMVLLLTTLLFLA